MINRYCYKCGSVMNGSRPCEHCGAQAIEVPKSKNQIQIDTQVEQIQADHKPKKGTGCIVMLVAAFVMFGLPATFMFFGEGAVSYGIGSILLLIVNIIIYKFRKSMSFEKESNYFNLSEKRVYSNDSVEKLCRSCEQLLTDQMMYCPQCSLHTGEDIPINPMFRDSSRDNEKTIDELASNNAASTNSTYKNEDTCKTCGANTSGKKFCVECGSKVEVI